MKANLSAGTFAEKESASKKVSKGEEGSKQVKLEAPA